MSDLEKSLNNPDEARRLYAVQDLEEDSEANLARALLDRLMVEDSVAVRAAIAFRLKTISCQKIYPWLFELFRSSDAFFRNAAVGIFASGSDEAAEFLSRRSGDADREVRKLVLDALFEIGTEKSVIVMRQALNDTSANVQVAAAEYLGRLKDIESSVDLISLLKRQPAPMLLMAVLDALAHLEDREAAAAALDILAPDRNYYQIGRFSLLQVLDLLALSGRGPEMLAMIDSLSDQHLFTEDLIRAISTYFRNEDSSNHEEGLLHRVVTLMTNPELDLGHKFLSAQILIDFGADRLDRQILFDLGKNFLDGEQTAPIGVELIAASKHQDARNVLENFAVETKEMELKIICKALLEPENL